MGELIRDLNSIRIGKAILKVELNKGTRKNGKFDVHIQDDKLRLNISEYDFCKIAADIVYSNAKLRHYKNNHEIIERDR